MDNKMENRMDNELDFRVGDVVCDFRFGTGKVVEIKPSNYSFPIRVDFGGSGCIKYRVDGGWFDLDKFRSLYHGTWEQVFGNLPDLKPKRKVKRWVNLYYAGFGNVHAGHLFPSLEKALEIKDPTMIASGIEIEVDE